MKDLPKAIIYADGSHFKGTTPEEHCGGWAAIITVGDKTMCISGADYMKSCNRAELTAIIMGLLSFTKSAYDVVVRSDSQYAINPLANGWVHSWRNNGWTKSDGKAVANLDLWLTLMKAITGHKIRWEWVRGHSADKYNELADNIARERAEGLLSGKDNGEIRATMLDGTPYPVAQKHLAIITGNFLKLHREAESTPDYQRYSAAGNGVLHYPISIGSEPPIGGVQEGMECIQYAADAADDAEDDILFQLPDSEDAEDDEADMTEETEAPQQEPTAATGESMAKGQTENEESSKQPAPASHSFAFLGTPTLGTSETYLLQLVMEMGGVKEFGLLRPCGCYNWCEACTNFRGACACADALIAYRMMDTP